MKLGHGIFAPLKTESLSFRLASESASSEKAFFFLTVSEPISPPPKMAGGLVKENASKEATTRSVHEAAARDLQEWSGSVVG